MTRGDPKGRTTIQVSRELMERLREVKFDLRLETWEQIITALIDEHQERAGRKKELERVTS